MTTVYLAPTFGAGYQGFTTGGLPLNAGLIYTYIAGGTTPQATYTTQTANVQNDNPIVLNADGRTPAEVWLATGGAYRFDVKDSLGNLIQTYDNLYGIGDPNAANSGADQWKLFTAAPTFLSSTTFSVAGDQTGTFQVDRRIKTANTGGTIYSTVTGAVFSTVTTVTVVNDSGVLDSGLSSVSYGLISSTNSSLPTNLGVFTTKGDTIAAATGGRGIRVAVGNDGQALSADSSQTAGVVYIDNPSRPNLLVNPNWQIDQINEGALYTYSATAAVGPDGWSGSATGSGVFKLRTLADPDNAALKCLEITCTTADASIGATDNYFIYTAVEGYDASSLMAGTSSAQAITVQFKFKTSVTGVYGISVANSATNRSYVGIFTVADTSEHEYSLSLTMDTTGTWLYTSGVGLYARICLAAGSNFQTTAGSWAGANNFTTSAQCNFMSANTNIAYLKRIQLMQGALVQAYKPADFQKELAKAQRYYAKTFPQGTAVAQNAGTQGSLYMLTNGGGASQGVMWLYPVTMRAAPTVTTYNPAAANANWRDATAGTDVTVSIGTNSNNDSRVGLNGSTPTTGHELVIQATANSRLS